MPPQSVWFLSRLGLKTGIDFYHYGLKSCMVFKGTTRAYSQVKVNKGEGKVTESISFGLNFAHSLVAWCSPPLISMPSFALRSENGCGK